jgi:lysozyme
MMTTPQNPPIPTGTRLWTKTVPPPMTAWAVSLLQSPTQYPMFSSTTKQFGAESVVARVEWHDWTYRNGVKVNGRFRGVTLYEVLTPPLPLSVEGVDVSRYQQNIDWNKVAASKVFAFIKATEGTGLVDPSFSANWAAAKTAGLLRGAYHFFRPKLDPITQADFFLSKVTTTELPPVLDVESLDNTSGSRLVDGVNRWLDKVTSNLGRPLVYASPSFWNQLPPAGIDQKADLWVAQWDAKSPRKVGNWPGWSFWQYSASGAVPGIKGSVDLNRFNGSLDDLHAYLTRTPVVGGADPLPFDLTTVLGVQRALNWLKLVTPPLVEDGKNGRKTQTAVRAFQRSERLRIDGIAGTKTRDALAKRLLPRLP